MVESQMKCGNQGMNCTLLNMKNPAKTPGEDPEKKAPGAGLPNVHKKGLSAGPVPD